MSNQQIEFSEQDGRRIVHLPEEAYGQLMAQASILRAMVYALGGTYEVSMETLQKQGSGPMSLGATDRNTISIEVIEPDAEAKLKEMRKAAIEAATRHKRDNG